MPPFSGDACDPRAKVAFRREMEQRWRKDPDDYRVTVQDTPECFHFEAHHRLAPIDVEGNIRGSDPGYSVYEICVSRSSFAIVTSHIAK
jgi:hypothetical protein